MHMPNAHRTVKLDYVRYTVIIRSPPDQNRRAFPRMATKKPPQTNFVKSIVNPKENIYVSNKTYKWFLKIFHLPETTKAFKPKNGRVSILST